MRALIHRSLLAWAAAVALIVSAAPAARAQQTPALTVSIASANEILGDIKYITTIAGQEDTGGFVAFMAAAYTQHLDTTKPSGVVVRFNGAEPVVTGFLPVKNLDGIVQMLEAQVGKPEDVGNGVRKMGLDQPIFFKEDGPWVFVSNSVSGTASIANPDAMIADLASDYDLGIRANIPAIPEPLRQMAMSEMKTAFERQMEMQANLADDPAEAEAQRKMSEQAMAQMIRMFEEIEEVTLGLSIDQQGKNVHMDMTFTAKEGSQLASQLGALEGLTSSFTGFVQPNAAGVMHFATMMTEEEIAQTNAYLATVEKQAAAEIDKDESLPSDEARAAVKKVLNSFMGVVKQTIETGKMDGGAVLTLDNGVNFVAGGHIADGNAVAEAFKELVELAKDEPEFPEVKFNAAQHAGVTFHTMSMPIPEGEEEARQALGDTIEVILGTGEKSAFVAFGKSAMDLTKKVIDDSNAAGAKKVDPMTMTISMGPIMKFAQKMDPDNAQLSAIADAVDAAQGSDQVRISAKMIPRGAKYRFQIDAGVIEMIAKAADDGSGDGF